MRISDILASVEAGRTPEAHEITAALHPYYSGDEPVVPYFRMACDGNDIRAMGAAKALHEAVLPGWVVYQFGWWPIMPDRLNQKKAHVELWATHVDKQGEHWHGTDDARAEGSNDSPARAWLAAIIKALIAEAEAAA